MRVLAFFAVYISLCWPLELTVVPSSDETVNDSLGSLEHSVPINVSNELFSIAALTDSRYNLTEIQQTPEVDASIDVSDAVEQPVIKSDPNVGIRFEELVDEGSGSEHYRLLEFVGSGSEGSVYKAIPISKYAKEKVDALYKSQEWNSVREKRTTKTMDRPQWVALKILALKPHKKWWISRELKLSRLLKPHPHLVSFISSHLQTKDNTVWIALGWLEGKNLASIVNEHINEARSSGMIIPVFDEDQTRRLAVTLFDALGSLHSMGATHGDVHLGNVLMDKGIPLLIDISDGCFEPDEMGRDVVMLMYALLECSVKPVMNNGRLGRIDWKPHDNERSTAMRRVLEAVAAGEFEVPEGMRAFIKDVVEGAKETTTANDPLIQRHPFLNNCRTGDRFERK